MFIQQNSFINQFIIEPLYRYATKERVTVVVTSLALCILTVGVGYLIYRHFFQNRKVTLLGNEEAGLHNKTVKQVSNRVSQALTHTDLVNYKKGLKDASDLLEGITDSLAGDYAATMKIDIQKARNKIVCKARKDIEENSTDKQRCQTIYNTALEELQTMCVNCKNNFPHNPIMKMQLQRYQTLKNIITRAARVSYSESLKQEFVRELYNDYTLINKPFAGETIFHFLAKEGGPLQFVEIFIRAGATFNIQDRNGYTPCMLACDKGHDAIALEIIKHGQGKGHNLDNETEQLSNTMLIIVAGLGYKKDNGEQEALRLKLVEELLGSGASPIKTNVKGFTPLHIACLCRDPKVAEILLRADPNLDRKTKAGLTPTDLLNLSYHEASNMIKQLFEFPRELDETEFNANLALMQRLVGLI